MILLRLSLEAARAGNRASRKPPLTSSLEKILESIFEVGGGDRSFGGVGNGLFAQVVEGEGPGRGEATAPGGLIQDEPHQLQRHLCVGLALFQNASLRSAAISIQPSAF